MKITMIGNFQVSYCTEQDWAWTYEHLGHEVIRCQEKAKDGQPNERTMQLGQTIRSIET